MPAAFSRLFRSQYDWNYVTLPQERADARPVYWPRGRVLGGSSAMNAMIYIRGNRADYDTWRDDYGCAGWGYRELFPYFLRAEDNSAAPSPYHGKGGPLRGPGPAVQVRRTRALHAGGHPPRRGRQRGLQRGAAGRRRLLPGHPAGRPAVERRRRLPGRQAAEPHGVTDALVTGVLIEGGRAAGVTYRRGGQDETARAEAEVILRGGRDRLAPAAHALRHRPGRRPAGARHLRDRGHARGRREPHRPPVGPGGLVHPVAEGPVGVVRQRAGSPAGG